MPGVILRTQIENRSPIPGLGRGMARLKKENLKATAAHWHDDLLRPHFGPSNRTRFQHEARTTFTKEVTKKRLGVGQGKYVDNVLKGKSLRFMSAFFSITGSQHAATLTMRPPPYFANPFIGSFRDPRTGETRRITDQPDKPREATEVDTRDRDSLSKFAAGDLGERIAKLAQSKTSVKTL